MANLWEHDDPITTYNARAVELDEDAAEVDIPEWIEQDITPADVAAILQGGCASGAYMPAVRYSTALETMADHGDNVLQYIEDACGELPDVSGESWAGMACKYVSAAVELWAAGVESELDDMLDAIEEGGQ